jgi:alanyl-tRNA synthetase
MKRASDRTVAGADVFKLYDTFGLRYDLIEYVATQRGYTLDQAGFDAELEKQRQRARESMKGAAAKVISPVYQEVASAGRVEFTGYQGTSLSSARVVALIREGVVVEQLTAGQKAELVLDRTPFYAESGGQIGDTGIIENEAMRLLVSDTQSPTSGLIVHQVEVEQGTVRRGDTVAAQVDAERRSRTMANHTATHLLHAALREVLGPHVKQAGSQVSPDRLRFDFTHFAPLTDDEIAEVERLVNEQTLRNAAVSKEEKSLDEALTSGAMALFGEKYSDKVRVVSIPGFSTELCGGTHVNATGDIGVFKIVSDSSIASGTRRIEALTGKGAYARFQTVETLLTETAARLNTATTRLPLEVERLQVQIRDYQREIERLKLKLAQGGGTASDEIVAIDGINLLVRQVEGLGKEGRRQLGDSLSRKVAPGVVVIGDREEGKASILVMVSADATARLQAGRIVKALPGARGGGKPDLAEGGVDGEQLAEALAAAPNVVRQLLQG